MDKKEQEMKVFNEYKLGEITLKNRVVMAPLTRARAINNVPNNLMKTYYGQRAGAGLIITEGTSPSANGLGYARIPGAFSKEQIQGWKSIAEEVQKKGSKLFVQLMHTGRVSSNVNLAEGETIMAPSAVQLGGEVYTYEMGMMPYDMPKAMTLEDIKKVQSDYVNATKSLIDSGVDGVELHSANGYFLDQFINPKTNLRTDQYGGSFKNRSRFLIELLEQLADTVDLQKVGVRFSPYGVFNDMQGEFEDLVDMYVYLAQELKKFKVAYIHIVNQVVAMGAPEFATDIRRTIKENFEGTVIVGGNVNSAAEAEQFIDAGYDLVYIGRPFISNPNLVEKLRDGSELVTPNFDLAYTPGPEGYTDYK